MKGRIALMREYGKPVRIEEYEVPDPEPGGLIVKIVQAPICGSDLHVWRGESAKAGPPAQFGFGHEGFGRVYKLGKGVTADDAGAPIKEGDRVVHSVGGSSGGRTPSPSYNRIPGQFPYFFNTFADYFYIPAGRQVFKVPDVLPDHVVAPLNCGMSAGAGGVVQGGVGFGSRVMIFGAGGLGLTATAVAKDMGAHTVIVQDRIPGRLALAREFGADYTIDINEYKTPEARIARVKELTGGRGVDAALEYVGVASVLAEGIEMLGPGGTYVNIGSFIRGQTVAIDPASFFFGRKKITAGGGDVTLYPKLLDFLVRNLDKRPFHKMISHTFKLEQINEALAASDWAGKQTNVTRAVIVP